MKKSYLFLCLCLFVDYWGKKKVLGTRACQTRVPYYKELELGKLEYHRRKKKSITLEFCIYKELELGKLEYCVAWNSSSMWHFSKKKKKKKSTSKQVFIYL